LYFCANNGTDGAELWTSDGTGTGTLMLQNLRPGAASSNPSHLRNFNGFIYFQAYDPFNAFPKALWRLDAR
jgi:ELWxxDGT repeat protein